MSRMAQSPRSPRPAERSAWWGGMRVLLRGANTSGPACGLALAQTVPVILCWLGSIFGPNGSTASRLAAGLFRVDVSV
jgi:hypothetical protein